MSASAAFVLDTSQTYERLNLADVLGENEPNRSSKRHARRSAGTSTRTEKMNAKIREHAMQKVPFQLVLGNREVQAKEVNVRVRGQEKAEGSIWSEAGQKALRKLPLAGWAGQRCHDLAGGPGNPPSNSKIFMRVPHSRARGDLEWGYSRTIRHASLILAATRRQSWCDKPSMRG